MWGSSQPRDRIQVSCNAGRYFTIWATWEAPSFGETLISASLSYSLAIPQGSLLKIANIYWWSTLIFTISNSCNRASECPSNPPCSSFMAIGFLIFSYAQGCLEFPSLPCSLGLMVWLHSRQWGVSRSIVWQLLAIFFKRQMVHALYPFFIPLSSLLHGRQMQWLSV